MEIGRVFGTVTGSVWNWWLVAFARLRGSCFYHLRKASWRKYFSIFSLFLPHWEVWAVCENSSQPPFSPLFSSIPNLNGISWVASRLWKEQTWYMDTASITVRRQHHLVRSLKKKKKNASTKSQRTKDWQKNRYGTSHLPDFTRTKNSETRCWSSEIHVFCQKNSLFVSHVESTCVYLDFNS